jgi:endonuclease/exonuclease/phosphatase (EEP) superfamily protein YafD
MPNNANSFSVLSWNIQGRAHFGSTAFAKILPVLNSRLEDIVCLQEVRNKEDALALDDWNHVYTKDGANRPKNFCDNVIITKFPVQASGDLIFKSTLPDIYYGALWADLLASAGVIRVYNCHLPIIASGISERLKQIGQVLEHARNFPGPIIICGDMNVTIPRQGLVRKIIQLVHRESDGSMYVTGNYYEGDERYVFKEIVEAEGFIEITDIHKATWSPLKNKHAEFFKLKLDWFFVKGMAVDSVTYGPYISDHRSLTVICSPSRSHFKTRGLINSEEHQKNMAGKK